MELHQKRLQETGHNPSGDYRPCPVNPVVIDEQGFPNHLPCPCENPDIDDLEGRAGPTLVTSPPALLQNLKRELEKFTNLKIILVGSDYSSPWSNQLDRSEAGLPEMSRQVFLVSSAQVISPNCLSHHRVSTMERLNPARTREAEQEYAWLKSIGFTLDACKDELFGKGYSTRRKFHISFARVVMDEAHNIRNKSSKTFSWLKYLGAPVWLLSGSAGSMSPIQWDGWRGLLEQKNWKSDQIAKQHTNNHFCQLQSRFSAAAKLNLKPAPRLDDSEDEAGRKGREVCRRLLEEWGKMLRAMIIRRCATDKLWGQDLLPLPEGVVEVIDFQLGSQSPQIQEAYMALENQEKEDASKQEEASKSRGKSTARRMNQRDFQKELQGKAYLKCRVASTLPGVCLIPGLVTQTFLKPWIEDIAKHNREGGNPPSILKSNLHSIIANSPKLRWLRRFVSGLGQDSLGRPEKLLIFSSSAMILYTVDLVSVRTNKSPGYEVD